MIITLVTSQKLMRLSWKSLETNQVHFMIVVSEKVLMTSSFDGPRTLTPGFLLWELMLKNIFLILEHSYIISLPKLPKHTKPCTYLQTTLFFFIFFTITRTPLSSHHHYPQIYSTCYLLQYTTTQRSNPSFQNNISHMYYRE
jgi:hypothetical protein